MEHRYRPFAGIPCKPDASPFTFFKDVIALPVAETGAETGAADSAAPVRDVRVRDVRELLGDGITAQLLITVAPAARARAVPRHPPTPARMHKHFVFKANPT